MKKQTILYLSATLLAAIVFAVGTAICFPHTYRSMEEDSLWLLTMDYWNIKLSMPPALTGWLADLLLQYYHTPGIAATIQASLLVAVALLAERWAVRFLGLHGLLHGLALLPAAVLGFCYTFETNFMLQMAIFFAMLLAYSSIRSRKARVVFGYVMPVAGYMLLEIPLLAILLAAMMLEERFLFHTRMWRVQLPAILLLYFIPIIYSAQVAFIPLDFRYISAAQFNLLTNDNNKYGERIRSYVHLADDEQWLELLGEAHCQADAYRGDPTALRFALLAESALGTLPENILYYPISSEEEFLFPREQNYVNTQFNRMFYRNLGVYDEAFHHAQECGLLQRHGYSFGSLRQMAEYSIAEGEWDVAEKYLAILDKSLSNSAYTAGQRQKMAEAKRQRLSMRPIPLRADNFVGGYPFPQEMVRLARYYTDPTQRKKMLDYAICCYLLRGDMKRFGVALGLFNIYNPQNLPRAYREALQSMQTSETTHE